MCFEAIGGEGITGEVIFVFSKNVMPVTFSTVTFRCVPAI